MKGKKPAPIALVKENVRTSLKNCLAEYKLKFGVGELGMIYKGELFLN